MQNESGVIEADETVEKKDVREILYEILCDDSTTDTSRIQAARAIIAYEKEHGADEKSTEAIAARAAEIAAAKAEAKALLDYLLAKITAK